MKKIILFLLLVAPFFTFSQEWIDDSNFEDKINHREAFEANAFADWDKIKGAKYYRVDIAKAPIYKKKYRIRMAPTLIVFLDGTKEDDFKAGLDLECPVTLEELQESINEAKKSSQF
jgi:hypothetical protein